MMMPPTPAVMKAVLEDAHNELTPVDLCKYVMCTFGA